MVSSVFHVLKGDYHSSFKLLLYDTNVAYLTEHYCECRDDIRQSGEECHRVNKNIEVFLRVLFFYNPCILSRMPSYLSMYLCKAPSLPDTSLHTHTNIHTDIHMYLCKTPSLPDTSFYEWCNDLCNG